MPASATCPSSTDVRYCRRRPTDRMSGTGGARARRQVQHGLDGQRHQPAARGDAGPGEGAAGGRGQRAATVRQERDGEDEEADRRHREQVGGQPGDRQPPLGAEAGVGQVAGRPRLDAPAHRQRGGEHADRRRRGRPPRPGPGRAGAGRARTERRGPCRSRRSPASPACGAATSAPRPRRRRGAAATTRANRTWPECPPPLDAAAGDGDGRRDHRGGVSDRRVGGELPRPGDRVAVVGHDPPVDGVDAGRPRPDERLPDGAAVQRQLPPSTRRPSGARTWTTEKRVRGGSSKVSVTASGARGTVPGGRRGAGRGRRGRTRRTARARGRGTAGRRALPTSGGRAAARSGSAEHTGSLQEPGRATVRRRTVTTGGPRRRRPTSGSRPLRWGSDQAGAGCLRRVDHRHDRGGGRRAAPRLSPQRDQPGGASVEPPQGACRRRAGARGPSRRSTAGARPGRAARTARAGRAGARRPRRA